MRYFRIILLSLFLTSCGDNTINHELIGSWQGQVTDEMRNAGVKTFEVRFTRDRKMYRVLERNGAKSSSVVDVTTNKNQLLAGESIANFTIRGDTLIISAEGHATIYVKQK